MSGGYFDYKQYNLDYISDEIDQLIRSNDIPNEWGDARKFSEETLKQFKVGLKLIQRAAINAQRIDWLVSGDDSEKCFHERLKGDLEKHEKNV